MLLAILVFIMFVGGTTALAKKTGGGFGRSSRGRLGGSRPRGFGKGRAGGASRSSRSSMGGASRSSGFGGSRGRSSSRTRTGSGSGRAAGGSRAARTSGGHTPWFFKAWNASGAPKTSETTWRGASAVVTGKAAGAASRGGWWTVRKTGRAGKWFAGRAMIPFDKWLERKRAGLENAAAFSDATPIAPDSKPEPATTPPPVFVNPTKKSNKGEHVNRSTTNSAMPSTLAAHVSHINDFEPESDADLLNFMGAEVAGKAAEAEAYMELFDRCVSGAGLDPQAMQGVSDYSEAIAESAEAMKRAHAQFVSVYEAIIEAANNGTVMPHDGRFFSGEANVA